MAELIVDDPAVEAAKRAARPFNVSPYIGPGRFALYGAREALAPLRELHDKTDCADPVCGKECRYGFPMCAGCLEPWPCATARLIYTTEELSDGE